MQNNTKNLCFNTVRHLDYWEDIGFVFDCRIAISVLNLEKIERVAQVKILEGVEFSEHLAVSYSVNPRRNMSSSRH